jgi:hypothetical protein
LKLRPPSRHRGHGRTCCWLDRVAIAQLGHQALVAARPFML